MITPMSTKLSSSAEQLARSTEAARRELARDRVRDLGLSKRELEVAKQKIAYLEYDRQHDGLTHALNRRGMEEKVLERLSGPNARSWAALYIDLDNFKKINDLFGHKAGDSVLVAVGTGLRDGYKRSTDSVFSHDQDRKQEVTGDVARPGGDEFIVIPDFGRNLTVDSSEEEIELAAQQTLGIGRSVMDNVMAGMPQEYLDAGLNYSMGLGKWLPPGSDEPLEVQMGHVFNEADQAMFAYKQAAGNSKPRD
jgi:diguanylate cyclase (GGDEF)-like protein